MPSIVSVVSRSPKRVLSHEQKLDLLGRDGTWLLTLRTETTLWSHKLRLLGFLLKLQLFQEAGVNSS